MFGFHGRHRGPGCGDREMHGFGPRGSFRGGPFAVDWERSEDGRGFGGGRGGGRRRRFDGSELRLLLLALLEQQPRHGYDLIREIEERTGGGYAPSPGVVYPTLTMLDELGQIDAVEEAGARKRFAIAEAGRAYLAERREQADALLARLAEMGESRARTEAGPVRRAMVNLHMALRASLGGEADESRAHDIAAILDGATRSIEQLKR